MQPTAFKLPSPEMLVIGPEPIVLHGEYDRDQFWLPFMTGVLLKPPVKPAPEPQVEHNRKATIQPGRLAKSMYHFGPLPQMLLPFREHIRIHKRVAHDLTRHNYPGWGRMSDDQPLIVECPKASRSEIDSFLHKNCKLFYYPISAKKVAFYDHADAALFRLMFGR